MLILVALGAAVAIVCCWTTLAFLGWFTGCWTWQQQCEAVFEFFLHGLEFFLRYCLEF